MFSKKYQYFLLLSLLSCILILLSSFTKSPTLEPSRYDDSSIKKKELVNTWKEDISSLWTLEEYEKRILKNTWTDEKNLELLKKSWPSRTQSLFYITKDWNYFSLDTKERNANKNTLQSITNALSWVFGEDDLSYYFFNNFSDPIPRIAIEKTELPHFQFIGEIGIQDIESLVGYSNGYLVLPPYILEVNKDTFSFIPKRYHISWGYNENYAKTGGWQFFINNGKQYTHYLGSDKDWVYRWSDGINTDAYLVIREKRASDFKLLSLDQIKEVYEFEPDLWIKIHPLWFQKFWKLLCESVAEFPELRYFENRVYVFWLYNNWSFPVNWGSLKREEKTIANGEDNVFYSVLSDDNYYYQLIYHREGAYYTLQKIKK